MACTTFHVLALMGCLAAFAGSSCGAPLMQSGVVEQRAASPTHDLHPPANGTEETDVLVQVRLPETTHVATFADFITAVVRDRRSHSNKYKANKWPDFWCVEIKNTWPNQCWRDRETRKNCCRTCHCKNRAKKHDERSRRDTTPFSYQGCYSTSSQNIGGYSGRNTLPETCADIASTGSKPFFGMEWPQGSTTPGTASCANAMTKLPTVKVPDAECGAPYNGRRLGGPWRVAVYAFQVEDELVCDPGTPLGWQPGMKFIPKPAGEFY